MSAAKYIDNDKNKLPGLVTSPSPPSVSMDQSSAFEDTRLAHITSTRTLDPPCDVHGAQIHTVGSIPLPLLHSLYLVPPFAAGARFTQGFPSSAHPDPAPPRHSQVYPPTAPSLDPPRTVVFSSASSYVCCCLLLPLLSVYFFSHRCLSVCLPAYACGPSACSKCISRLSNSCLRSNENAFSSVFLTLFVYILLHPYSKIHALAIDNRRCWVHRFPPG